MDFFEKLQEVIYDALGYLIPGIITLVVIGPLLFLNKVESLSNITTLQNSQAINYIRSLASVNYTSPGGIALLFGAYLLGHLVKYLSILFYKATFLIEKILFLKRLEKNTDYTLSEAERIFTLKFNTDISSLECNKKEKILSSFGRAQIRMHKIPSFVQKYISKYNFYQSLSFISFVIIIKLIIMLTVYNTNWLTIIVLPIVFSLVIRILVLNSSFQGMCDNVHCNFKKCRLKNKLIKYYSFNCLVFSMLFLLVLHNFLTQSLFNFTILYVATTLLYLCFDNEYKRHFMLSIKESLHGIIYVEENEETKYSIRYKRK